MDYNIVMNMRRKCELKEMGVSVFLFCFMCNLFGSY